MVSEQDIDRKDPETVVQAAEAAGIELEFETDAEQAEEIQQDDTDDEPDDTDDSGEAATSDADADDGDLDYNPELGYEWIETIRDREGAVIPNDFGNPAFEIIVPREVDDEVKELIESWSAGAEHDVRKLSPSISDDPDMDDEVVDSLTGMQFAPENPESVESAGYQLGEATDVLDDEGIPYLWTISQPVDDNIPRDWQ